MKPLLLPLLLLGGTLCAQQTDKGLSSITEAELRNHIFFLASDYMNGRVSTTPEYAIAANYVASQFKAAGLQPAVPIEGGEPVYMQGLPFARTVWNDKILWTVSCNGKETQLLHKSDYKIMQGSNLNHENLQLVYVGYGIEDPGQKWNDFKDLDLTGKIVVCLSGTPRKNGEPVLPKEVNDRYNGRRGNSMKVFSGIMSKGAVAVIMVDLDGSSGQDFDQANSTFTAERTVYKGSQRAGRMGSFPTTYMVKPAFLDLVMAGNKNNPNLNPDNVLKNYKPQALEGITLNSKVEILTEDVLLSNNVIGVVPGTDPVLKDEYIVVGGHLDHVRAQQGKVCNGADDNASGSAGVMEIAEAVALNPCKRTVIFATWSGEEMGLLGSAYFLESGLFPKEKIKFNINLDMIGRTGKGNEETRAHYVVTDKKYVQELKTFINDLNKGVTDFPILIDDDEHSPGGSDHMTFIQKGIPAFFFFSGIHADLHNPGDDPEKIDYPKAAAVSKLGYLIALKLGNMDVVPTFQ
ncbi:MAG: hypothetical protein A2X22_01465 [Bacteroidetes bacterium GWF2_49_14]|nr:MAG: hypothetical protein A2X22_01465 [Bacteroidetes bacterium GWF2_49_14]